MALILCIGALFMALYFVSFGNGFLAAIFLIISTVAYMNHSGGSDDDDHQTLA